MYTIANYPEFRAGRTSGARGWLALGLGLVVGLGPGLAAGQQSPAKLAQLRITFLVNAGFLLEKGEDAVLIDSFVRDAYYGYGALPESAYQQLIRAEPPFADIDLALTSHIHLDHFQVEPAALFLRSHPQALLLAGEEVVVAVRGAAHGETVSAQTRILWPEPQQVQTVDHAGIRVHGFRLRHSGARNREVQNLGVVLDLHGTQVLHVGDAEATAENFDPFDLPGRGVDVAILPIWMVEDRAFREQSIGAKQYLAAHIPAADLARTKRELAARDPEIVVLEKPLESWTADE